MTDNEAVVLVVGMGEVGRPLLQILNKTYRCVGVDIEQVKINLPCDVMHVCYPFSIPDYIGTTLGYIHQYRPALTIINSTVSPGTTRKVQEQARDRMVAFSPVRGKHARMEQDMRRYRKFVAAPRVEALRAALNHFNGAGLKTAKFRTPELAELSKLLETTYLGVLVAWAQEIERLAGVYDGGFDDVNSFIEEIDFLPSHTFPGTIGGHCVLPNIAILQSELNSPFFNAVLEANERKLERLAAVVAR